jgi:hypothetical protein
MKKAVVTGGALWNPSHPKTSFEEQIDPANPGPWKLLSENEDYRYWVTLIEDGSAVMKTEHKGTVQLLEDNQRALNDSDGQQWGDGQVFGSVPTDVYFKSGLAEANKQRDKGFQRRFWNDFDNRKYRKFKGMI